MVYYEAISACFNQIVYQHAVVAVGDKNDFDSPAFDWLPDFPIPGQDLFSKPVRRHQQPIVAREIVVTYENLHVFPGP